MKYFTKIFAKKIKSKMSKKCFLSLEMKLTTLFLKFLTKFSEIGVNLRKIPEILNKNNGNRFNIHKNLNIDSSLLKPKFKKMFLFPCSTLDELSNDTTHNSLR